MMRPSLLVLHAMIIYHLSMLRLKMCASVKLTVRPASGPTMDLSDNAIFRPYEADPTRNANSKIVSLYLNCSVGRTCRALQRY